MLIAAYARFSSDKQRDASIEDQFHNCRAKIEAEGWQLVNTFCDRAMSGATTLRPGYQNLLEEARQGRFDAIIAESLDRFSRDQEDIAGLYKILTFAGVKLITLAEGEISEIHIGFKGTMNAIYLKDLAQKTHRGLAGRVRDGKSPGGRVFGYEIVRRLDEAGNPIRGERTINDCEAAIVKRIFREFEVGRSPASIAKGLNAEGIPGPGGRPWQGNTINGHSRRRNGVLRNELYVGILVWNRQRFMKNPETGKRMPRLNPPSEWIVKEVPEFRIIDDELWNAVAQRLEERERSPRVAKVRASRFWERRRPQHLLTKLVKCGRCDSNYTSTGGDYLACAAARKLGTCDNKKSVRRHVLEEFVLDTLKDHLMHPDLVKEFIAAFHAELNVENRKRMDTERQVQRELSDVSRRLDGLIEAIAEGLRSPELQDKLDELSSQKRQLESEVEGTKPSGPILHPNLAELYRRKVAALRTSLDDPENRDEAITILRSLIDHVVMHPVDQGLEVQFVGEIANMIGVPHGNGAKAIDQRKVAVKRVAGARYQRYLQLDYARL